MIERALTVRCPACGEHTALWIDPDEGSDSLEGDCQVCCRPFHVDVMVVADQVEVVAVRAGW